MDTVYCSEACWRANAARAAFLRAILEEDMSRIGAFASMLAEDASIEALYKIRYSPAVYSVFSPQNSKKSDSDAVGSEEISDGGGKTPLMLASEFGLVASVESILEVLHMDPSVNATDSRGLAALHMAAKNGHRDIVTMLCKKSFVCKMSVYPPSSVFTCMMRGHVCALCINRSATHMCVHHCSHALSLTPMYAHMPCLSTVSTQRRAAELALSPTDARKRLCRGAWARGSCAAVAVAGQCPKTCDST